MKDIKRIIKDIIREELMVETFDIKSTTELSKLYSEPPQNFSDMLVRKWKYKEFDMLFTIQIISKNEINVDYYCMINGIADPNVDLGNNAWGYNLAIVFGILKDELDKHKYEKITFEAITYRPTLYKYYIDKYFPEYKLKKVGQNKYAMILK